MAADPKRAARLRQARERAKYESATHAAKAFGWVVPTYLAHENGSRGFPTDRAIQYARAFRVNPAWLITGAGAMVNRGTARVVGTIVAGEQVLRTERQDSSTELEEVYLPVGIFGEDLRALRIRGNSMRPLRDGWLIFYREAEDIGISDDALDELCVVKLADGRKFVKELRRGYVPGRYNLESWSGSSDAMIDQEVEWAVPIEAISRR